MNRNLKSPIFQNYRNLTGRQLEPNQKKKHQRTLQKKPKNLKPKMMERAVQLEVEER
jgi:hypothetical protein